MALQIPAEFPLGLVFVMGEVEIDPASDQGESVREFYLLEGDHHLLCCLSERAAEEFSLNMGDQIRAGGHIVFDATRARYCLQARDIELIGEVEPAASPLGELIVISAQKPDEVLSPALVPQWVQELAPPEVQREWAARSVAPAGAALAIAAESFAFDENESAPAPEAEESWQELIAGDLSLAYSTEEPPLAELSDELIDFLSEAIDSSDDIELTPALLAEFTPPDLPAELVEAPIEEVANQITMPDPERAFAAQDASIEEFLSALEAAIVADETRRQQQEVDLNSKNGQLATAEVGDVVLEADQPDQGGQPAPDEPEESVAAPPEQPASEPTPRPKKKGKQSRLIPLFVALLVVVGVVLLIAIAVVMAISTGLLPLVTNLFLFPHLPLIAY